MHHHYRKLQHLDAVVFLNTAFDPDQFAQMPVDAANDTTFVPLDEGEYPAVIEKYEFRSLEKSGQVVLDVHWNVDSAEQREKTGRDKLVVRQSVFIDRTPQGALDMGTGKNVQLGRLREATGLNVSGQAFTFTMLVGRPALIKTKNRKVDEDTFTDVKAVTRL